MPKTRKEPKETNLPGSKKDLSPILNKIHNIHHK